MSTAMLIEIFGYVGTVLVVVSMLMTSVVKLRIINMAGNIISAIYGLIIGSFPLALMNISLLIINIYNLHKLYKTEQQYDLIDGKTDDAFLGYFLKHYAEDIKVYFPNFKKNNSAIDTAYIICCNAEPAGVLLGKSSGKGEIEIVLEYTTPTYRDCSVGTYLYSELSKAGVKKLTFANKAEKHEPYLQKMGYTAENGVYVKKL